ncbi:MAG: fibro-slime domain-containing protein [Chitinivibrionales bacterium]
MNLMFVFYRDLKLSLSKFQTGNLFIAFPLFSLLFFQANAQTYPPTIKIPVTFYDYHSDGSNPEFEKVATPVATHLGMVADTLDAQRKPILGSMPYFDCQIAKWFRPWTAGDYTIPNYTNPATTTCSNPFITVNYDTAFKNLVFQDTLVFTFVPGSAGTYTYQNSAFFPLDGLGFGADEANAASRNHNYSFSMELHWQFTKVPGLTFQFAGDDDFWAFINNKLVLDIGGIHNTTAGSLNVDTLGLTNDSTYTFDIFYCERRATGSDIQITTNIFIPASPQNLSYSKNPAAYTEGTVIIPNTPTSQGGAVSSYSISPSLTSGLTFNTTSGVITGTPTTVTSSTTYTVIATNLAGSDTATLSITIGIASPTNLTYSANPAIYMVGAPITPNTPSSQGGAVSSYSISPQILSGLTFNTTTGILSGTPAAAIATTLYTIIATNAMGSDTAKLTIKYSPQLLSAVASNSPSANVLLTFDKPVNIFSITYQNINSIFQLSNGHSWLSGFGTLGSAVWNPESTMVLITLLNTVSSPTIAIGDTITFTQGKNSVVLTGSFSTGTHNLRIKNLGKFSIKAFKDQIVFSIRPDLTENSRIKIQNLSGKLIADFQGSQRTIWNCKGYSAGLYIARIYLKNDLVASIPIVLSL